MTPYPRRIQRSMVTQSHLPRLRFGPCLIKLLRIWNHMARIEFQSLSHNHPQTIRHQFSVQLSLLFQMVCCILLTVLPSKTLLLAGGRLSTANQDPPKQWFQSAKQSIPFKGALKTVHKNSVRLFVAFCLAY